MKIPNFNYFDNADQKILFARIKSRFNELAKSVSTKDLEGSSKEKEFRMLFKKVVADTCKEAGLERTDRVSSSLIGGGGLTISLYKKVELGLEKDYNEIINKINTK